MTPGSSPHARRSFVHPRLVAAGAAFRDIGDALVAAAFPATPVPPLGLADLSPLPGTGLRGGNALAWLAGQGWPVPPTKRLHAVSHHSRGAAGAATAAAQRLSRPQPAAIGTGTGMAPATRAGHTPVPGLGHEKSRPPSGGRLSCGR